MTWTRDELRQGDLHWLLDLTWAGRTLYLAEAPVAVTIGTDVIDYGAGLGLGGTLVDGIDLFSDDPEPRSISLTLSLPLDVPALVQRGHDLGGATGKLYLWCSGTTRRALWIDGVVRDPEYETRSDPVVLSLDELPADDSALWPPDRARVDAATWPNASEKAAAEYYPWILGTPGLDDGTAGLFGSPGLHVDGSGGADHLLIAGHPVAASAVAVRNFDDDTNDDFAVLHKADGEGRRIAYIDLNEGGTSITVNPDHPYWVRWESATGGGVANPDGTTMRGAGDQLVWWLRRSSIRWDAGRVEAIRGRANGFLIDSSAVASPDSRIAPWEWITEHLLPVLPLSARQGPGGLHFVWFSPDAAAVATLDADAGHVQRQSPVLYSDRGDVANEIRLSYRPDAQRDKPLKEVIVTGSQATLDGDSGAIDSGICRTSVARYGLRVQALASEVVCDTATAQRVCLWRARAFAIQARRIVYSAPQDFGHIEPGDVVLVTDSDVSLSGAPALVEAVEWSAGGTLGLRLRLIESPARVDRGT